MGTTKWNKKENMKIKRNKTKESFKQKIKTGIYKLTYITNSGSKY